ncbi:MAG: hypothetical protein AB1414_10230 [bacterium]
MPETTVTISLKGREQISQAFANVNRALDNIKGRIDAIKPSFGALAAMTGAFTGAIVLAGKKALDEAGNIEKLSATMTTITGSTKEATDMIQFAIKAATQTPFEVKGVVESTATIMQFTKMLGWTGKDAQKWFPLIGDLAAGMGKDLKYTSLVMGKALTGSQDAILSLRDQFGISAQALKAFGAEMNKEGGIAVRTAEQQEKLRNALEALIKQNFAGAMARQMDTWEGAMSNLHDAMSRLYMAIGATMIPMFNKWIKESLTPGLEKIENFIKTNGNLVVALGAVAGAVSLAVASLATLSFTLPHIIGGFKALQLLFAVQIPEALKIAIPLLRAFIFSPIGILTLAIGGLTMAFLDLKGKTDAALKSVEDSAEKIKGLVVEYNSLATAVSKTTEQKQRQKAIIDELKKVIPEYAGELEKLGGKPIKSVEEINRHLLAQYNLAIANMSGFEKLGRSIMVQFSLARTYVDEFLDQMVIGVFNSLNFVKDCFEKIGTFLRILWGVAIKDFGKITTKDLERLKKAGEDVGKFFTSGIVKAFKEHGKEGDEEFKKIHQSYEKKREAIKLKPYGIEKPKLLTLEDFMSKAIKVAKAATEEEIVTEEKAKKALSDRLSLAESRYRIGKLTIDQLIEEYAQVQKLSTTELERNQIQEKINSLKEEEKRKAREVIEERISNLLAEKNLGKDVDTELVKQYNSLMIITDRESDRLNIQSKIKDIMTHASKIEADRLAVLESDYNLNKDKRAELIEQLKVMRDQTQDTIERNNYEKKIRDLLEEEKRERETILREQIAITRIQSDMGENVKQKLVDQLTQLSLFVEKESERLEILQEIKKIQKEISPPVVGIGGAMPEREGWITAPPGAVYTEGEEIKPIEERKETVFGSIVEGFRESVGELQNIFGMIQESTRQLFDTIAQTGGMAFEKMFFGMQDFSTSVKELWSNLAHSVVNYIGQMITKWLAFLALQEVAGFFGISLPAFQTAPGEIRKVPGPPTLEVPAIVHGGEIIGRPAEGQFGMAKTPTVNINISAGAVLGGNEAQFKQAILDIFKDYDLLSSRNLGRRYS